MDGIQPLYEEFGTVCGITDWGGGFSCIPGGGSIQTFIEIFRSRFDSQDKINGIVGNALKDCAGQEWEGDEEGGMLMALVDALIDAHAVPVGDLAAALSSLVMASSVSPSKTILWLLVSCQPPGGGTSSW